MASTIVLKRRIKTIGNTRQITKAMQLVSASKLRRAQEQAQASREYREMAYDILRRLNAQGEVARTSLFNQRKVKNSLYIVVTSNTGLAGAYNSNVLKKLTEGLREDRDNGIKSQVITIGSKGAQFVRRLSDVDLVGAYPPLGDHPTANDIRPILNTAFDLYQDDKVDSVQIIYTLFKSTIVQEVQDLQLLPAPAPDTGDKSLPVATFEPDVETVVEQVTIRLVEAQLWQAILESTASEHAMRMIATKNATDNANDLIKDYTLELNTARQVDITQQIAEISGGAEAMNG